MRTNLWLAAVACVVAAGLCGGCAPRSDVPPDRILKHRHAPGDNQTGPHGALLDKPFRVVVEGPQEPGLLGGQGSRHPAAGVPVTFTIDDGGAGGQFETNGATQVIVETDVSGEAQARMRLGHRTGDIDIEAAVTTPSGEVQRVRFRAAAGVERLGTRLEAPTGESIPAVGLRLQNHDGTPAAGVNVYFRVGPRGDAGAKVASEIVATDADGVAVTTWTLGSDYRQYVLTAEIDDRRPGIAPDQRLVARSFRFEAEAVSLQFVTVFLLGGLAIFVFGMKLMSGGLQRMADRRLKSILQAMTRNSVLAVGVGALLTAMVQSSSATTVMVVGFVNAGLLSLTQAIGVVYGANIGTTITGQIIAYKLTEVVFYPAIAIGLLLFMAGRRPVLRHFGEALLGFGLLFLGMTTMSDTLEPLGNSPTFQELFTLFDCTPNEGGFMPVGRVVLCVLIGTITTVMVQSSSATIGLVLALASQDLLTFYTAFPLILGDNIGTTITANLAALGANRNAKRAALAHFLFNSFGAAYMIALLFMPLWNGQPVFLGMIDAITPGDALITTPENLPRHIANAHTAFNLANCLLFLPFIAIMARVCQRIVPLSEADKESVLQYLEPRLLQTPSLALQQAIAEVTYMVRRSQKSINEGCDLFFGGPPELEQKVLAREDLIDRLQQEITAYLVELSRTELAPEEAALIPALIHVVNDAERIGDHSENLIELTHLQRQHERDLPPEALDDIRAIQRLLNDQFETTLLALTENNPRHLQRALAIEREITETLVRISEVHVSRLESDACDVQSGVFFLDFLAHLERVGDHLMNIAERADKVLTVTST